MIVRRVRWFAVVCVASVLAACGSSEPVDENAVISGKAAAARLLTQGTFGPTAAEIDRVTALGAEEWLDQQFAVAPTYHQPECQRLNTNPADLEKIARTDSWWKIALTAPDQLRQRVALALSEIMVVSDLPAEFPGVQEGLCWYYDILVRNAFGDFRRLLEEVTLSPAMGRYLSMLGNQKPDAASGRRSDENFARESMQLFTIGLFELNSDGSQRLSGGEPIPTYTQADIEGLARALTGWYWKGNVVDWLHPMQPIESRHDTAAKTLIGGVEMPAGGSAQQDLDLALDTLFQHANVGPFIGKQLIQKLVTSNPSPAYVGRVAKVFNDNGGGRRGDLQAVIRAVLLDREARQGVSANRDFGKAREPLLRMTHLWRALSAEPASASGRYSYRAASTELGQSPLSSPSVFNFYSPRYSPAGEIKDAGLVAPELQLANESSLPLLADRLMVSIYTDYVGGPKRDANAIAIDLAPLRALAADPAALVDEIDLLMMNQQMPSSFRSALIEYLAPIPVEQDAVLLRVQEALYLTLTSPQYQIQK